MDANTEAFFEKYALRKKHRKDVAAGGLAGGLLGTAVGGAKRYKQRGASLSGIEAIVRKMKGLPPKKNITVTAGKRTIYRKGRRFHPTGKKVFEPRKMRLRKAAKGGLKGAASGAAITLLLKALLDKD